ncbi:hypothetical protein cypCar_00044675 [Cyprinus carpio]|nr:hypothetical protein cypCar_00044675 [Cyprinus carpio]
MNLDMRINASVFGDVAVKSVSVMEGESVTLNIDVNTVETVEKDDQIQWRFRHNFLIALIYRQKGKTKVYDDVLDGRFRGRLELDQTGSLTITDTRTTDSGLYEVKNTNNILYTFNLTVYDHICSCGFTEAVIRLVLSALVGVAAVAVLVYDIRSRSLQQKKEQTSSSSSD